MKEAIQEFSKATLTVMIVLGAVMVTFAAVSSIKYSGVDVAMPNSFSRAVIGIIGLGFICFAVFLVWRESVQSNKAQGNKPSLQSNALPIHHQLRSRSSNTEHRPHLFFSNASNRSIQVFWINYDGLEEERPAMPPGSPVHKERTFSTHPFLVKDAITGERLFVVMPVNSETDLTLAISVEESAD